MKVGDCTSDKCYVTAINGGGSKIGINDVSIDRRDHEGGSGGGGDGGGGGNIEILPLSRKDWVKKVINRN